MANPLRSNGSTWSFAPQSSLSTLKNTMNSPFRLDEGYSEETRSQSEGDTMRVDSASLELEERGDSQLELPDWVKNLNEVQRSEFAYAILRSLRTSSIAAIVERLTPLLHIDFVHCLPAEITHEILSYLDTPTLLKCSQVSKAWRERALDSRLWMHLFAREGWGSNMREVRRFREEAFQKAQILAQIKSRPRRMRSRDDDALHAQKKRLREGGLFGNGGAVDRADFTPPSTDSDGPARWAEQHGIVEADEGPMSDPDDRMQDVSFSDPPELGSSDDTPSEISRSNTMEDQSNSLLAPSDAMSMPIYPSLALSLPRGESKLNWQYLYKQKIRLEDNWNAGRYKSFQLPHPNHPEESHAECVYTIQYSAKYLVSGSRDMTLRIWDLETQRLVRPALKGHEASVLCLQFDERPEEDLIVSGGSDCHIFIWKFSTGEVIKKMTKAHNEPVLNLRFDERYLVTCSKDKSIRVWNRRDLLPTDDAYPTSTTSGARFPSYIINMQEAIESEYLHTKPLQPFSLLMTLYGHTAAVNAIQILDDQIVSASGDRSIKLWDVRSGMCLRTYTGHSKGIACVQYDGRRIVSGSSDETVRIFDRATAAEVACLRGHTVLVRTVQARFGDLPGNEAELEAEAKAVDKNFFDAKEKGLIPEKMSREQRRARNAGSRDPKDLFAHGAKIPPGGGGTKWGRIVSGSYDETVIIWKRDASGKWVVAHRLLQTDAVRAAGGRPRAPQRPQPVVLPVLHPGTNAAAGQHQLQHGPPSAPAHPAHYTPHIPQGPPPSASAPVSQSSIPQPTSSSQQSTVAQNGSAASSSAAIPRPSTQQHTASRSNTGAGLSTATPTHPNLGPHSTPANAFLQSMQTAQAPQIHAQIHQLQAQLNNPQNANTFHPITTAGAAGTNPTTQVPAGAGVQPGQQHLQLGPHHHHHHHHHHHPPHQPIQATMNSRVFKLQFDARRIICCSQDPTIVGWDFANGDREIEEASRFFAEEG